MHNSDSSHALANFTTDDWQDGFGKSYQGSHFREKPIERLSLM